MSVVQRKRNAQLATIKPTITQTDARGATVNMPDPNPANWLEDVKVWEFGQRSGKAEVPGQQAINVTRLGMEVQNARVDIWSRITFQGKEWDVVTMPKYSHGTKRNRHWSMDIRERGVANG